LTGDARCRLLDAGAGHQLLVAGCWLLVSGHWPPVSGSLSPDPGKLAECISKFQIL